MEAIETFDARKQQQLPVQKSAVIPLRIYKSSSELQEEPRTSYLNGMSSAGSKSDPRIGFRKRVLMSGWTVSCKVSRMPVQSVTS